MDCASATIATATLHALAARGIFIRKPAVPPLDRCIRVTAAPEPGLDAFARALPEALAAARAAADGAGTGRA
jgi:histidinol-phosphate aminotransferase